MAARGFFGGVGLMRRTFAVDNARANGRAAFGRNLHLDHNNPYHDQRERKLHLAWRDGWLAAYREARGDQ